MKITGLIASIVFWLLVAIIPIGIFFLFYESESMQACKKAKDCIFIDDRELLLKPLFVYSAILLWPLVTVKIISKFKKQRNKH